MDRFFLRFKEVFSKENFAKLKTKAGWKAFFKSFFYSFAWVTILVFILDISTKWAVQSNFNRGEAIVLIPNFLNITLSYNTGAAWGLGSDNGVLMRVIWILVSIFFSLALILFYFYKIKSLNKAYRIGITLMIAGALGNLIDRAFYWEATVGFDGVIDWIQFIFGSYYFPTFNIADSSLVIGVIIIIVMMFIDLIKETIQNKKDGVYDKAPIANEENKSEESNIDSKVEEEIPSSKEEENGQKDLS